MTVKIWKLKYPSEVVGVGMKTDFKTDLLSESDNQI